MSLKANPLQRHDLSPTVPGMTASERARQRLKDELSTRDISQRDLADLLSRRDRKVWSQSKVGKLLKGRVSLKLDDLALVADALSVHATEFIRDRGLEFYAEMTPTELRVLERLRQNPEWMHALMTFFRIQPLPVQAPLVPPDPTRRKRGRPKTSERLGAKL